MIDFSELNTALIIKAYKRESIFPRLRGIHTLNSLKQDFPSTRIKVFNYPEVKELSQYNLSKYLELSMNYSLQSFFKGISYYYISTLSPDIIEKSYSTRFLGLYYAHTFLSYSILQFNGIHLSIKTNSSTRRKEIVVNYPKLLSGSKEELFTGNEKTSINHKELWEIFYDVIDGSKAEPSSSSLFIGLIPGASSYFLRNNFLDLKNESECRNFYTYNYNMFVKTTIGRKFEDDKKTTVHRPIIQSTDFNKIKTTVELELVYLLGLFRELSYKVDYRKELLKYVHGNSKNKILSDVDDFTLDFKSYL